MLFSTASRYPPPSSTGISLASALRNWGNSTSCSKDSRSATKRSRTACVGLGDGPPSSNGTKVAKPKYLAQRTNGGQREEFRRIDLVPSSEPNCSLSSSVTELVPDFGL